MLTFQRVFPEPCPVIGMVHLRPLPGSPGYRGRMGPVLDRAVREAEILAAAGFHGVLVENFGDTPFLPGSVGPETVAAMTVAVARVAGSVEVPVGVNVLRNDARAALAVASATGARFVRVNVHTGATVTDQGVLQGRAHETLRERSRLGAEVLVFADVLVKHGAPLGPADPAQVARETVHRGHADALLVTGRATGEPPDAELLRTIRESVPGTPVLLASGLNAGNATELLPFADGAVVGTSLKRGGSPTGRLEPARAERLLRAALEVSR